MNAERPPAQERPKALLHMQQQQTARRRRFTRALGVPQNVYRVKPASRDDACRRESKLVAHHLAATTVEEIDYAAASLARQTGKNEPLELRWSRWDLPWWQNSWCPGKEKRMMHKSKFQIGNSGFYYS